MAIAYSSSYEQTRSWKYDVFLSFRGEDTRNNIVDHLFVALVQKGIHTFKDDEMLGGGKPISQELVKAIEESRFAIIVFSKNYANSSWCLDELAKIMDCQNQIGQKVFPLFYHVDPSDVRGQKRDFATAFQKHEERFKGEMDKVFKWRKALTGAANLSGWHITPVNGGEYGFIKKIVEEISGHIQPRGRENNLIGIESRMDALRSLLRIEATQEVRIIGIFGMGGIGKTTIAQALFRRIAYKFEGSSFIKDVRENGSSKKDLCALQEKILRDILMEHHGLMVQDPEYGADLIQERLCNKKVLLVLDDVDNFNQLEFLAATHEWFGPGSRIIITTRDEHLLSDANAKYKPALLLMDQAVELFSRHAFRKGRPPDEYKELTNRAIGYTGHLPLALKILGSFFRGRNACVWESALDRLSKIPNTDIFDTLKLSFVDLNVFEQKIFLDIACFFKGRDIEHVIKILDSFSFHPGIGIAVLIEKSLITIAYQKIGMHDLIQEMGWQIVRTTCPNSRLWKPEEIHDYIPKNKRLKTIEAIVEPRYQVHNMGFRADVFKSMKNLRLLDVNGNFTSCQPTLLPDELRWLHWNQCPFSSLPVSSNMNKLVGIDLDYGRIEHLWNGQQLMQNLKFIHLHDLSSLTSFPDVSGAPNIETLILSSCRNLVQVHESLGSHKRLVYLDMMNCWNLKCLPYIEMESLEILILINCHSLERCPEFSPCMVKLSHIDFYGCYKIKELTASIRYTPNLCFLNLESCTSLEEIPNSIYELKCLKTLCLHDCRKLHKLPEEFGSMENLEELQLGSVDYFTHFEGPVDSINFHSLTNLSSLRKLDLSRRQIGEEDFPENLHGFSALEELCLSGNSTLVQLPASISHLSRLKHLEINECCRLQNLNALPSAIQVVQASYCHSLEKIKDLSEEHEGLYMIWLFDCQKLLESQENERYLDKMLKQSFLKKYAAADHGLSMGIPGSRIPSWFNEHNGHEISLKLRPKWQTEIKGFAICGVFMQPTDYVYHNIRFRFESSDSMCVPKSEVDCLNAFTAAENGNVWIGYIPFSVFQQKHGDDFFQYGYWSDIVEGNLVASLGLSYHRAVKCGVLIVYKEDLELIEQDVKPSASSSYWNWKFVVYDDQKTIVWR